MHPGRAARAARLAPADPGPRPLPSARVPAARGLHSAHGGLGRSGRGSSTLRRLTVRSSHARIADCDGCAGISQPGLLDHVLGVAGAAEHAVGDREEEGPEGAEFGTAARVACCQAIRSSLPFVRGGRGPQSAFVQPSPDPGFGEQTCRLELLPRFIVSACCPIRSSASDHE